MKITKRANGFWYLYKSRTDIRSLGTKDKSRAQSFLDIEKAKASAALGGDVARIRGISILDFTAEYLIGRRHLVSINELSADTLRADEQALKRLFEVLGDISLRQVDGKVTTFKNKMLAGAVDIEKKKNTINTYIRHLCSAFSWAACPDRSTGRPAYISRNPFAETRTEAIKFRGIERLPKYLDRDELDRLRHQLDKEIMTLRTDLAESGSHDKGNGHKSLASRLILRPLLEFSVYTGMRVGELVGLSWGDLRLQDGFIHLKKTKGRKERMVPIAPKLATIIEGMGPKDIGRVFPWTRGHASRMFKELARRTGLDESKNLKGMRHSFGTLAADGGMDVDVIQGIMGHKSMRTTEIYKDILDSRKAEQARGLNFGG